MCTIDELPVYHPHVHRQGPGHGAAGAAAAAARRCSRRLPSGRDDSTTGQADAPAADRTPRRALAATGPGGGLLLPFELELQVTATRVCSRSLRPFTRIKREWICTKVRMCGTLLCYFYTGSKYCFFNENRAEHRRSFILLLDTIKNARTKGRCRFTSFSLFRRIANSLRWSPSAKRKFLFDDTVCRRWCE